MKAGYTLENFNIKIGCTEILVRNNIWGNHVLNVGYWQTAKSKDFPECIGKWVIKYKKQ